MIRRAKPFLLGTIVDITVFDDVTNAADAIDAAFQRIQEIHESMSFHVQSSDLSKINSCQIPSVLNVSKDLIKVLSVCLDLNKNSEGIFNPAVAAILQKMGKLPVSKGIANLNLSVLSDSIVIESDSKVLVKQAVCLDLGGIAKGYAVDEACKVLKDYGLINALVNAGGDIKALGPKTHNIKIRHPYAGINSDYTADISEQAFATSAPYLDPQMPAHVDGRNGYVYSGNEVVSIKAKDCIYADALCKIAFFLNEDKLEQLLEYYDAEMIVASISQNMHNAGKFSIESKEGYASR